MKKLSSIFRYLIYVLPLVLFFSYYPVISLGESESMNFELSLPLIWLVLFDVVALVAMIHEKCLLKGLKGKWAWFLFPLWLTLSVVWSLNMVRGVLTVGILWLVMFAGYGMWNLRDTFKDDKFRKVFGRWFFGSTIFVCGWCLVQCVLDLVGVSRDYSLMCEGCTYQMFGFPHPNGFAIEPQFMGNLLLAPALVATWLCMSSQNSKKAKRERSRDSNFHNGSGGPALGTVQCSVRDRCKNYNGSHSLSFVFLLFWLLIITTLFLTFSRGAIYAFVVGMVVLSAWVLISEKLKRKTVVKRVVWSWVIVVLAFVLALNVQGLMAEVSPTNDTYKSGVAKVLNHLSLGVIDLRGNGDSVENGKDVEEERALDLDDKTVVAGEKTEVTVVENSVENSDDGNKIQPVFDGYVAESTDTRMRLSGIALEVWKQNPKTAAIGVGLGGAGSALYENELSVAPKEIVQNQYVSILLETGIIGVTLFVLLIILIIRAVLKNPARAMLMSLIIAYAVTLCFFSGLPNALQIYLLPIALAVVYGCAVDENHRAKRKKLVS